MAEVFGEDIVIWIFRFILIVIILLGVLVMITKYYSNLDVRPAEALAISNRIIDCISADGIVDASKISKEQLLKCTNLDENEIYVNLTLNSMDTNFSKSVNLGADLEALCRAKEKNVKIKAECLIQKFYVLLGNEKAKLDLVVGIKKGEKNVV